eukprot:TRINITY_DN9160_c0_g1_i7.p1 TRINITY_DN9160_c0_g1~~TRINITY_DN9160_c0_g1_i7.p1  ORF type:complete len:238 (-),score=31.66 TRINITY_DN9160_c0_g1_i7:1171-1815(-)
MAGSVGEMVSPQNQLEEWWLALTSRFTDFQLMAFGTFFLQELITFGVGIPFMLLETLNVRKHKIQPNIFNSLDRRLNCVFKLLAYHWLGNFPLILLSYPTWTRMGMKTTLPLPPWKTVALQIAFFFVIEDFIFYWGHRALHTKFLYQHVHRVHHESHHHDYHHRLLYTKSGNYASTFTYMDWLFGTDTGYRKLKALEAREKEKAAHDTADKKAT